MADNTEETLQHINQRLDEGEERMNTFQQLLEENTKITKDIKEILDLGKSFFKFLSVVGKAIKWIATVATGVAILLGITNGNSGGIK